MLRTIDVHQTISALEEATADFIASHANASIRDRGMFIISLAGGATPRGVYRCLATSQYRDRIDWRRVHLCFGDERMVPPDDPQSNYGMVKTELLSRVPIPQQNVHRIYGEGIAEDAAREYAAELQGLLHGPTDRFDLVLLGLGEDGHTASLFPGSPILDDPNETVRAVFVPWLKCWRVTMTLPLLNRSRDVLFLVTGKQKAAIVQRVVGVREPLRDLPATMVQPSNGSLRWMLDIDAAAALGDESMPDPPHNVQ